MSATLLHGMSLALVCTRCHRQAVVATGFTALQLQESGDTAELKASAERLNWEHEPTVCAQCLGRPEPEASKGKDQG